MKKPQYGHLPLISMTALPALLITLAVTTAEAQQVEEILVSDQRRAYRGDFSNLETPQAIQILDSLIMDQAGVRDLNEALDLSASVARQNNFGGLWNSFAVRGFVGDENLPSNYLVNGFNAGRGFGGSRDISGIESVEVLKGPTAALFGRGEPGGAVNLVTKRPTGQRGGEIRFSADEFDTYRTDMDFTSASMASGGAFRVVGFYEDGGSFRDAVDSKRYGLTPSVQWQLTESTTLFYELEATRQALPFDRGVVAVRGELGVIPASRFLGEPGDGDMEAEVLGHQLELRHALSENWDFLAGVNYRTTSMEGFSTEPELTDSRQRLNLDGRTLTRQRRQRAYDSEYVVYRAEMSGSFNTGRLAHRILLGADTDQFDNDQIFKRYRAPGLAGNPSLQASYALDILAPVYGQYPLPNVSPLTDRLETLDATGAYLQDQININERLQIRLGVRFDDFSQTLNNRLAGSTQKQSDERFSPQMGLVYAISSGMSFYTTYGEGFRATSGADFAGNTFDPNESISAEAGIKFELSNRDITGNIAVFRQTQNNILSADPVNAGFSVAIGKARSKGLEFDLAGTLADINFYLSYAYVKAETASSTLDFNFGTPIASGDPLLNVPEHTFNVQLSRDFNVGGTSLTAGGGLLHVDERLGEVASTFMLPDYTLLRAFVSWQPTSQINLRAELDNVLDETYYTNSFSQLWIQPGSPQRLRLSAAVTF
ncbi:MAG: TonB-dependent siderophore receptor [Gammaproteobacteria bacterium]|nr:TonB-dependent siderophore receptor [Gammaproteobacteria bacterium]